MYNFPPDRSEHRERVDQSPAELLTGQGHAHWLEFLRLPDPLRNRAPTADQSCRCASRSHCLGEAADSPYCYRNKARFEPGLIE